MRLRGDGWVEGGRGSCVPVGRDGRKEGGCGRGHNVKFGRRVVVGGRKGVVWIWRWIEEKIVRLWILAGKLKIVRVTSRLHGLSQPCKVKLVGVPLAMNLGHDVLVVVVPAVVCCVVVS